jgi:2-oxoglutarate ferredoxin oxidoreductase subunit gamma
MEENKQMIQDIFMAGFGGQGVLLTGNLLAYTAIEAGLNASFFPAYGVEKRGGAANCTVVISDGDIGSPVIGNPSTLLVFNPLTAEKYYPQVKVGGFCLANSSLIKELPVRDDVETVMIPATEMAIEAGDTRLINMVMLGAMLGRNEVVSLAAVKSALAGILPERNHRFLPMNHKALDAGFTFTHR